MATNREHSRGGPLDLDVSGVNGSGTGDLVLSGDPGAVGDIPFVALTDEGSDGIATVAHEGVYRLTVNGRDATPADAAVAAGDILFWDDAEGQLNLDGTNGIRFGYALEAVAAGAATEIKVRLGY